MKGTILAYSAQNKDGIIVGEDEKRYSFEESQWKEEFPLQRGDCVDFEAKDSVATEIYKVPVKSEPVPAQSVRMEKSKMIAAFFAFFLGCLGIHKFYLNRTKSGVIYLVLTLGGGGLGLIGLFPFFIFPFTICVLSITDCILYLIKTDEEFERVYVTNNEHGSSE